MNRRIGIGVRAGVIAASLALAGGLAAAQSVGYAGTLASGTAQSGTAGGFGWADEAAAQVQFWRFSGMAGDTIDLRVTRTDAGFDPAFSLYEGTTTADGALFLNDADWGGLRWLTTADDEVDHPGPGGDPWLQGFVLPGSGSYTVAVGGFQSATGGSYGYTLDFNLAPVPEPGSVVLMALGLAALAVRRRA